MAIVMTGCGDSNNSTPSPTPTPTPTVTPTPTPTPTLPPYAQPASINPTSVTQILQPGNLAQVQLSNGLMAGTNSVTGLTTSLITEAIAMAIVTGFGGDVDCSVFGASQGSGSIHVDATTLPGGGNGYTINFNECKFDTMTTLSDTNIAAQLDIVNNACSEVAFLAEKLMDEREGSYILESGEEDTVAMAVNGEDPMSELPPFAKEIFDAGAKCTDTASAAQKSVDHEDLADLIYALIETTALDKRFEEAGRAESLTAQLQLPLNDTFVMNGTLKATVNLNPGTLPAFNIWDTTFAAESFSATLYDNAETTKKLEGTLNGDLAAKLNGTFNFVPGTGLDVSLHLGGGNNLAAKAMIASTTLNTFIDFGIVGEHTSYAFNINQSQDFAFGPADWRRYSETNMNDSGDGYLKAYFNDNAAAYHGEISLYNKQFVQTRNNVTDPSAIPGIGIGRKSTYTINGGYGMNTQGIPFIWNTQGAFTYNTSPDIVKTKVVGRDYGVAGGQYTLMGTAPMDFQFLPDPAANNNDGIQDGNVVVRVGTDLFTLPIGIVTWLEVFPQP